MRRIMSKAAVVAALLLCAGLVFGQQPQSSGDSGGKPASPAKDAPPAEKPSALEEMIAQALKDNPDVRVAEAKLREAEAELNRTRHQVVQKVVQLQRGLETQRALVASAEAEFKRATELGKSAAISEAQLESIKQALLLAKAKLADLEAELPYVLGRARLAGEGIQTMAFSPDGKVLYTRDASGALRAWDAATGKDVTPTAAPVAGTMAEKIRKALDTPASVEFTKGTTLAEILENLQDRYDVPFRLLPGLEARKLPTDLRIKEKVPLGAVLQALEDTSPVRFVVRDYGILAGEEGQIPLPGGVMRVHDFWKGQKAVAAGGSEDSSAKNPPPENVEGEVKEVDAKSGLMTISIGSDAGLQKGHTLEVYRLNPPKYLGTIRIIDVRPKDAVGKPQGRTLSDIQAGDKIASKIKGS
jgi:hypothetical protein